MGTNVTQRDDGGIAFVDDASASEWFKVGGTKNRNVKVAKVSMPGVTATTAGALLAWQNPENVAIIIDRIQLDITTKSSGASNGTFGMGATATTASANLIDTYALGGTEKVVDNMLAADAGTLGKPNQVVAVGAYVTGTGSGSTAGMVAVAYIHYHLR